MSEYYLIKIALVFLGSLLFSIMINRIFLKFSKNLGIRNLDETAVRWDSTKKPAFGGISFFIVFLLILSFYPIVFPNQNSPFGLELIGVVLATSIGFLVGLADDAFNTNPILKSLAQALCSIILIVTGNYIQVFEFDWLNYLLTFLWVVGLMNSVNMLDNMDAVTTIASIMALIAMLLVLIFDANFNQIYFILVVGLIGALLGFLFFNWHPSNMYMGDTGSQFLGIILAALSIKFLWNFQVEQHQVVSRQFILPLLAFLVPICDTTTVTINRIARGQSPFVGGKDHTTHHLSYLGFSDQSVALIIGGLGLISTVVLLIAINIQKWTHLFTIIFGLYVLIVFLSLFLITKEKVFNLNKTLPDNDNQPKKPD
tara:strand:- start:191 stop:1300 length:1110 start_codon:yes stop_codon:yes gene_type:complete